MPPKKVGKMILVTSTPKPVNDTPVVASKPKEKKKLRLKIVSSDCTQCPGLPFNPPPAVPPTPSVAGPVTLVPEAAPSLAPTSISAEQLPQVVPGREGTQTLQPPTADEFRIGELADETSVDRTAPTDILTSMPMGVQEVGTEPAAPSAKDGTPTAAPEVVISDIALEPTAVSETDLEVAPPIPPVAPEASPLPTVQETDVTPDMLGAPDTPDERNELRNREDIEEHEDEYGVSVS